jgi:hypothetical protein
MIDRLLDVSRCFPQINCTLGIQPKFGAVAE